MRPLRRHALRLLALASLAACAADPVGPGEGLTPASQPAFLLANDESYRTISDTVDAAGNHVTVAELAAGVLDLPDGTSTSVASVTITSVIPAVAGGSSSGPCITSTIQKVETTAGWSYSVKKSGGCDKEIIVALENKSTRKRAQFSFLMIFGKTRIDHGLVR
jgi:hypothetical protein